MLVPPGWLASNDGELGLAKLPIAFWSNCETMSPPVAEYGLGDTCVPYSKSARASGTAASASTAPTAAINQRSFQVMHPLQSTPQDGVLSKRPYHRCQSLA